jgi:hypothetical protein
MISKLHVPLSSKLGKQGNKDAEGSSTLDVPFAGTKGTRILGRPQMDQTPMLNHHVLQIMDSVISSSSSDSDDDGSDDSNPDIRSLGPKQQTNRQAFGTWNRMKIKHNDNFNLKL